MPGLTGILTNHPTGAEEATVQSMVDAMLHEPFYSHGFYADRKAGLFLGYVSIKGSFSDCMPIWNEDRTCVMFLTGECYSDQAPLDALRNRAHQFNAEDASFLIHQYEESGVGFLSALNGWINGLILDLREQRALLFNDRAGIRRVYYHEAEDRVYFASEAKSLLKVLPALRRIEPRSVGEYMTYDCVLQNRTWFPNVLLLPPGSAWTFDRAGLHKESYFTPRSLENQPPVAEQTFLEELSTTFSRVLPRYFRGRVGLSLTGGLDTRMILAARHPGPGELPCYTFAGSYRDTLDVRLGAKVARRAEQTHQILRLDDARFLADYPDHLRRSVYYTDGLEAVDNVDVIPMNRMARGVAPVRMTGKYGSQVLKSLSGFRPRLPAQALFNPDFQPPLDQARQAGASLDRTHSLSAMLSQEIPWWWNGFVASESTQVSVRSPFLDNDLVALLYRAPSRTMNVGSEFQAGFIRHRNPELMAIPTNRGLGGSANPVISSPTRWLFWVLNTADKLYIREQLPFSLTHWLARCDHLLAPLHLDRLVMGFWDHRRYRVWFRDQLGSFLNGTLASRRTLERPYWNGSYVRRIVEDHTRGRGNYLREIRKLLQVEMVHRVLVEDAS
jgi:asparagine synthase (glutamine-hydrolysing)